MGDPLDHIEITDTLEDQTLIDTLTDDDLRRDPGAGIECGGDATRDDALAMLEAEND